MKYQIITDEVAALEAVKQDGSALQYVKDQTDAVCLEAVKQKGFALRYVKDKELYDKLNYVDI